VSLLPEGARAFEESPACTLHKGTKAFLIRSIMDDEKIITAPLDGGKEAGQQVPLLVDNDNK
jgi:hypothetical protein